MAVNVSTTAASGVWNGTMAANIGPGANVSTVNNDTVSSTIAFLRGSTLDGIAGSDTLTVTDAGTITFGAATITQIEIVNFTEAGAGTVSVATNDANFAAAGNITVDGSLLASASLVFNGAAETNAHFSITGSGAADTLSGGAGNDSLSGGAGDDTLAGAAGNDTLYGGAGLDSLVGGTGDDVFDVDNAGDTVAESAAQGTDTVQTALASYTLAANLENLTGTVGTGQSLTGNSETNSITGGGGNDTLFGGTGADTLVGGGGNDRYIVDVAGDVVTEAVSAGTDEVQTPLAAYTLAANIETLTGTATTGQALTGNGLANAIATGSGNDTLDGGGGDDTLAGGAGNDHYIVDAAGDVVSENTSEGSDEVQAAAATYILGVNIENLTGTGTGQALTGNGLANAIAAGSGNDTLDGGTGADTLVGGAGNDRYIVDAAGDLVTEGADAGTDDVQTALATYTLPANVENLTGAASTGQSLIGNAVANIIAAGAGNDTLSGGDGADSLAGGAGINTLTGGVGNDTFAGSAANLAGDTITDFALGDAIAIAGADLSTLHNTLASTGISLGGGTLALTGVNVAQYFQTLVAGGNTTVTLSAAQTPVIPISVQTPPGGGTVITVASSGVISPTAGGSGLDTVISRPVRPVRADRPRSSVC